MYWIWYVKHRAKNKIEVEIVKIFFIIIFKILILSKLILKTFALCKNFNAAMIYFIQLLRRCY